MEGFSPLTRKIIAGGLLVLALLLAVQLIVEPLVASMTTSVGTLRDARYRRARLEALQARPGLPRGDPVPPELLIGGRDPATGLQAMTSLIQAAAVQSGAKLDYLSPLPIGGATAPQPLQIEITANGTETTIETLVAEIERGTPLMRLKSWSVTAPIKPGDPAHLDAIVAAVWGQPT